MSVENRPAHSGWPVTPSPLSSPSTSLSSSFSSSAASDMLPQDSSQSDFHSSDHSALAPKHPHVHNLAFASPRPRSSSLAVLMGQNISRSPSPSQQNSSSSQLASKGIAAAAATGSRLKRAFGARRKNKSEDTSKLFCGNSKGKERDYYTDSDVTTPVSSTSRTPVTPVEATPPPTPGHRPAKLSLQLATHVFNGGRKNSRTPPPITPLSSLPPPPPPKPPAMQGLKLVPPSPARNLDQRGSIITVSPGISSAVNYMRIGEEQRERERERLEAQQRELEAVEKNDAEKEKSTDKGELKETWRKSDSTMSHHTIRPGTTIGNRTPRPVSVAESLQSIYTIVPPVNKRLSALITDADYATPEEDISCETVAEDLPPPINPIPSPTSSIRAHNRRSMSLNLGSSFAKVYIPPSAASATAALSESNHSPRSVEDVHPRLSPSASRETPTLTRAAANGIISPSSFGLQSTGTHIRGRLAAWTATTNANPSQRSLPTPPSFFPRNSPTPPPPPPPPPSSRQPTISMTGGFGLAKRAVEKINRAWGGLSSGSSNSGYSSSSSSTGPSSYSDHNLARIASNQSGIMSNHHGRKSRRTLDAPSGAWSINSSTTGSSLSDSDAFTAPAGPLLGQKVRGPMRTKSTGAGAAGGIVFGRNLRAATRDTAIGVGVSFSATDLESVKGDVRSGDVDKNHLEPLEGRMVPAVVVRCAQHLLLWGIQEEGLFRVPGRALHIAKLRAEFDTGADFDMTECSPAELDPHAVASVFKAFLRELPEPILTYSLLPQFEAAISQECVSNVQEATGRLGGKGGPTLPSGPRSGLALRKPPSLSTLAMPSFSGMQPPSRSVTNTLKSLLSKLPYENKDLIRTVIELIKATAQESKSTKMPISNLLLVFCPSLSMNPPLLKVLCEAEDLWEGPLLESPVIDIKRESVVLDISASDSANDTIALELDAEDSDEEYSDAPDGSEMKTSPPPSPDKLDQVVGSPCSSTDGKTPTAIRLRPMGPRQHVLAGVFSGTEYSSRLRPVSPRSTGASSDSRSVMSYGSTSNESHSPSHPNLSPPPLSSSAESLATPSSSSAPQSLTDLPTGLPVRTDPYAKEEEIMAPVISDCSDLGLPKSPLSIINRRISGPVQFPGSGGSEPSSPLSPRRSVPLPSLPSPTSSPTNSLPGTPRRHGMKRPSLNLLFSKRSASPLSSSPIGRPYISSPYLQNPSPVSDSSISTPTSAVTAPQSSTQLLPHVIDTAIESPTLRRDLGLEESPSIRSPEPPDSPGGSTREEAAGTLLDDVQLLTVHPGITPIADHYRSLSSASLPLSSPDQRPSHLRQRRTLRNRSASKASYLSNASSNHLGLLDDEDKEDWTQSVLMAADADGGWTVTAPSSQR
ncbi:RhoGAP-domain-containing protein [Guyanagaster necrorhizus]|uniref:RhoGAP-domain-containing protein n=1 Tax=Guyanagaster necrorhizus TaxID=856835 RepID=A0A9P7VU54_9AGAR|nr:RhoGAP-domain-containing protein [Guyanagaster necrorhizus MCA 3950]KAG7446505.1 RhoGAP-domain-containing protein [Guyanagaster necrorhizus MCA 3950]